MKHAPFIPLQPLLFRETGLLLFAAGILAVCHPLPALVAAMLIALVDSRIRRPACLAFALLAVGLGCLYGWMTLPAETDDPEVRPPAWLEQALIEHRKVRVTGRVLEVKGLPDRRLQLILDNVRPEQNVFQPDAKTALGTLPPALPGRLVWVWEEPLLRPLPGQTVTTTLFLRPARGFHNPGSSGSEHYWHRHGVYFQGWSHGDRGDSFTAGQAEKSSALREKLRLLVRKALAPRSYPSVDETNQGSNNSSGNDSFPTGSTQNRTAVSNSPITTVPASTEPEIASGGAVILALLFGDRYDLRTPDLQRFYAAGIGHSLALSGQHLAVAGLLALLILAAIRLFHPLLFLHVPAYALAGLFSLPPAAVYLWLGNAPPSLLRAALLLLVWCVACCLPAVHIPRHTPHSDFPTPPDVPCARAPSRFPGPLVKGFPFFRRCTQLAFPDALLIAFGIMLLLDAGTLYEIGAQLSFTAVAGIALCAPLFRGIWNQGQLRMAALRTALSPARRIWGTLCRFFLLTMGCSLAAQLATLPLTLDIFGYTTCWSFLNVLWLPVLGLFVLPTAFLGMTLLACGAAAAGSAALAMAAWPCEVLISGLQLLQNAGMDFLWLPRPHWTAMIGFAALLCGLALWPGRRHFPAAGKRLLAAGCVLLLAGPLLYLYEETIPDTVLHVLDVGQAQSLLLEWQKGFGGDSSRPVGSRHAATNAVVSTNAELSGRLLPMPSSGSGRGRGLVDGGGFLSDRFDSGRDLIAPVLARNHPLNLDFLALSHPDRDHLRGFLFLAENFRIAAAYTAPLSGFDPDQQKAAPIPPAQESSPGNTSTKPPVGHDRSLDPDPENARTESASALTGDFLNILAQRGIERHTLTAGDILPLSDSLWLEVLAPGRGEVPRGNNGLVLRLVCAPDNSENSTGNGPDRTNHGTGSETPNGKAPKMAAMTAAGTKNGLGALHGLALLPGDATRPYLRALLRRGTDLSADVLILPHHGSKNSFFPELLDAVNPCAAIASAGNLNAFRHPAPVVREALAERGIPLYVTGEDGAIAVRWNDKGQLLGIKSAD